MGVHVRVLGVNDFNSDINRPHKMMSHLFVIRFVFLLTGFDPPK